MAMQILRLEIPWIRDNNKPTVCALGVDAYLDGKRLFGIKEVGDFSNYPHEWVKNYALEIYGEFEIKDGVINGKSEAN